MTKITNDELVSSLVKSTDQDRIDWQPTGTKDEFTASFGGKWTLLLRQRSAGSINQWLSLKNSEGETLLQISATEDVRISILFELARRHALKINEALADLLKEIGESEN